MVAKYHVVIVSSIHPTLFDFSRCIFITELIFLFIVKHKPRKCHPTTPTKRLARPREEQNASGRSGDRPRRSAGAEPGLGPSGPARRGPAQGRSTPRPTFRREWGFYCKPHDSRAFRLAGGLRGVSAGASASGLRLALFKKGSSFG